MESFGGDFKNFLETGGIVMYLLLVLSVVALAVIIERFIALTRARINVSEFLQKIRKALMVNKSRQEAIKVCEQYRGPVASIMKAGLLKFDRPKEDIEKAVENAALYEIGRLERGLTILATIANVAPLLGFFGTVTGMIASFDALAAAGLTNPGLVAAGIKEALYTTAGGLGVAIPVQIAYNFFLSRINKFVRDIETAANMLLETYAEMGGAPAGEPTAVKAVPASANPAVKPPVRPAAPK